MLHLEPVICPPQPTVVGVVLLVPVVVVVVTMVAVGARLRRCRCLGSVMAEVVPVVKVVGRHGSDGTAVVVEVQVVKATTRQCGCCG